MVFRRLEVGTTKEKKENTKVFFFFEKFNLKPTLICVGSHPHQCLLVLASVFRKITSGGQNEASFGRSKATSLPTSSQYTITILVDIYYTLLLSCVCSALLFCALVLQTQDFCRSSALGTSVGLRPFLRRHIHI